MKKELLERLNDATLMRARASKAGKPSEKDDKKSDGGREGKLKGTDPAPKWLTWSLKCAHMNAFKKHPDRVPNHKGIDYSTWGLTVDEAKEMRDHFNQIGDYVLKSKKQVTEPAKEPKPMKKAAKKAAAADIEAETGLTQAQLAAIAAIIKQSNL